MKLKHSEPLTNEAHRILIDDLKSYGNQLNQSHKDALYALVRAMTEMSQGILVGRYAFSLPTGMGKTQGIIAWITALHKLGLDNISVSVSASKVEALCSLKRALMEHGVPEDKIGLLHSYQHDPKADNSSVITKSGFATLPSTGESDRQIMLVTHQRLRSGSIDKRYHTYKGKPRNLMLYDESLIVSDSLGIDFRELKGDIGKLMGMYEDNPEYIDVINYVEKSKDKIQTALTILDDENEDCVIELDAMNDEEFKSFQSKLKDVRYIPNLRNLIEVSQLPLRIINAGQSGLISYQLAVPDEIKDILILDASYPIRDLIKLDSSIKDAEKELPYLQSLGLSLSKLKRFDNVRVKQMYAYGGRTSMTKEFNRPAKDWRVINDVCNVVTSIPKNESVLIFTFKEQVGQDVKFTGKIIQALSKAGVNCEATVPYQDIQRKRINIVTWGMETSLNDFNHCQHVILLGVLHRSRIDLASYMVGQSDDLKLPVDTSEIMNIQRSELIHLIYQAASRGSCRTVDNGYAKPMTLYLVHKHDDIKSSLDVVMPNLILDRWDGDYSEVSEGQIIKLAKRLYEYLKDTDVTRMSIRELKNILQLNAIPPRTFTAARQYYLDNLTKDWILDGRSLVTVEEYSGYGFVVETT